MEYSCSAHTPNTPKSHTPVPPVSGESTAAAAALVIVVAVVVAVCSIEMEGLLFVGTTIRPRIPRKNTVYFYL